MRDCPVCSSRERKIVIPNYWDLDLYECDDCGMHYVDSDGISQAWFDDYYLNVYKTDDKPYSDQRLGSLARFVASYTPRKVLDIGGMDGELQSRIVQLGIPCDVVGVKNDNQEKYDIVVISHTLEHIYDIPSMFSRIFGNLGNRLVIEIPVWLNYSNLLYDNHWQHINKFTSFHLGLMLAKQGLRYKFHHLPDYREYHCLRVLAWQ